jgi:hypothetical protein
MRSEERKHRRNKSERIMKAEKSKKTVIYPAISSDEAIPAIFFIVFMVVVTGLLYKWIWL